MMARITITDEPLEGEPLQRPTSRRQEVLAQSHAIEHVVRNGFGQPARVVARAEDRIEADRVEIHDLVRVPSVSETGVEAFQDGVAKRPRIGMREDGQDPHASLPPTAFASVGASRRDSHRS
jgi:hypothetical protein